MSRSVRNALAFVGLVALAWALLVLACRVARWLLIATVWLIVLAVTGAILLSQVVTQRFPPWIARGRAERDRLELAYGPSTPILAMIDPEISAVSTSTRVTEDPRVGQPSEPTGDASILR